MSTNRTAYKGYIIQTSPFTAFIFILKENKNIASALSIDEAKSIIDMLVQK
jgi:hypothetical protein